MKQAELPRKIYTTSALLAFFILLVIVAVIFLNPTSVGSQGFLSNLTLWAVVWAINFTIILILLFMLARDLIKLFFEYQTKRPGSRLKSKLVLTLTIFSLFPAVIMFFLASGLINQNLKLWFRAPSEQLLASSQTISAKYYEERRNVSLVAARYLITQVDWRTMIPAAALTDSLQDLAFEAVTVFNSEGEPVYRLGNWDDTSIGQVLNDLLAGREHYVLQHHPDSEQKRFEDRGIVGVPALDGNGSVLGGIALRFVVPESVMFHAAEIQTASQTYEAMAEQLREVELNYFAIVGLTMLAVVFGFVWLGTYIAKRITVPLEALAAGSREIAEGNLDYRVQLQAPDELGILVDSFNQMADEINQSRQKREQANSELRATNEHLDERRRYIETILQNITTGVVSVDENEVIRTANEAALKMFGATPSSILDRPIKKILNRELYAEFQEMKRHARLYRTYRKRVTFKRGDGHLPVAATITRNTLAVKGGVEHLIVLDDLTELIRAEKFAAWQEVARRLAHEIKNPLTPIRLSAERVKNRFEKAIRSTPPWEGRKEFEPVLNDGVRLIVAEAEMLRSLVEEFSRFARLPTCKPIKVELHPLIQQTLSRYDGALESVKLETVFDPRIDYLKLDPEQIQRVFFNLIDNSLEALTRATSKRRIGIRTRFNEARQSVAIEFDDNGVGIPPEDYEHLFLPYFSTKERGTGLGLAIVRQIVSEHNGFIRAEPNHPEGTRFIMELPIS